TADVQLEDPVVADAELIADDVGFRCVAERLVQYARAGGARALHGDVEKSRGAAAAGHAICRTPVDPGLLVGEVGAVATELAGRAAERVQCGIAGVASLQRQIEGLAEVLGEEPERVDALRTGVGVGVLERPLTRVAELFAERRPCRLQRGVVGSVAVGHRQAPNFVSIAPTTSQARRADSSRPSFSIRGPISSRSKPWA